MTDVSTPEPAGLGAREAASRILDAVLERGRPLDEALAAEPRLAALAARDRAFMRLLVATVLRRLGQIDALIDARLAKPLPSEAKAIRQILRLGVAQILFLKTPPHAAVDLAVRQADPHPRFRGLVNAVLRRLAEAGEAALAPVEANCPDWLLRSWRRRFGVVTARAILEALMADPPLDLTVKADPGAWAERLGGNVLPTGTVRLAETGAVEGFAGYGEGAWWVQDAAASLPVRLLGEVEGREVLDLCAAPGGKTLQLAAAGADVVAVDRSKSRLKRLEENLARVGLAARIVTADLGAWRPEREAALILLDAPCSATGTIRRHPDIWRLKSTEDVNRLASLQRTLLIRAVSFLAPGGCLMYCVCSLEAAEGIDLVEDLLATMPGLARRPIGAGEVAGLEAALTPKGDLVTHPAQWPDRGGIDGFQIFRLTRP